jgi:predicted RNA-binding Zn-ribbon protein involved in translation (DUF1610 family)
LTPNIEAGVDTSMLARDGARDNYVELNRKLDKALEYVKNRLLTNKAAYAKPKGVDEGWSQKYKSSINCSHPKGFSQKAHCAGKKKHNESIDTVMEMTCPDCGMCETHVDHTNLDEACWKGYHKEGNKKMFGKTYPNCVKNENEAVDEADMNRRGFLKGMGAAAVAGAADNASASTYDPKTNTTNFDVDDIIIINKFLELYWLIRNDLPLPPDKKNEVLRQYQEIANRFTSRATNGGPFLNSQWSTVNRTMSSRKENTPAEHEKFRAQLVANAKKIVSDFEGLMEFRESVNQGLSEEQHSCPHCGGEMVSEELMNEKKDACYYKVKSRYKVWPSAYASGALVKCRKKGASNWGTGGKKNESSILEGIERADESLHDWFNKEKWVRMDTKGNIKGPCAREPGEGKPKCLPQSKAHSLGKKGRASAAQRKRREDPNPERSGKAINVNTKKK